MERIILYGVGKAFEIVLSYIEKMDYIHVDEIWDNDKAICGKKIFISDREIRVMLPSRDNSDRKIVITSEKYFDEIKNQLIAEFCIDEKRIKRWMYIFDLTTEKILSKYAKCKDKYIIDSLAYIQRNKLEVYNGTWVEQFAEENHQVIIFKDAQCGMYYTMWADKKLYLKKDFQSEKSAQDYVYEIMKEQDIRSPHCYKKNGFEVKKDDVVLDGGAAEGFFALECVDKALHTYIVEGDAGWLEALEKTFAPFRDKVTIIPKWLGQYETEECTTLENINRERTLSLIKLDIEGAEEETLKSALEVMKNEGLRIIACTYHKSEDANRLEKLLKENGLCTQFSDGYMFFMPEQLKIIPDLRHGLIFGTKERG